ncbi:MAG TPA: O-antigen ligase family protein [Terriglobales bacterium]
MFGCALVYASVVVSGSRGGMLACAAQLVTFALCWWLLRRRRARSMALLAGLLVSVAVLAVWLDGSHAIERLLSFQLHEDITGGRAALYGNALHMIRERPFFGFGIGTFGTVFPQYRSFYTSLEFTHLHNDILQPFVEMGIVGGVCWLAFLGCVLRNAVVGLFRKETHGGEYQRALQFASFVGIVGLTIHSFADFNLHIPANAALFTALCAWATNRPEQSRVAFELMRQSRKLRQLPATR